MTGKSRHGRGKYSIPSKIKKGRLSHPAVLTRKPVAAQIPGPVSRPDNAASPASVPTLMTKAAVTHYPHIATELRTIGILAGVVLGILAVIALVLT